MRTSLITLIGIFLLSTLSAQVGVNNNDPVQALDVNGKVKLADDEIDPSEGTMRYNDGDKSFEGYDGAQWNSFSAQKTGALPSNPVPVYANSTAINRGLLVSLTFGTWQNDATFQTPPAGKLLIVTGIYPWPQDLSKDSDFLFTIGVSKILNGFLNSSLLVFFVKTEVTRPITGDSAPLFVLRPGEYLTAGNQRSSSLNSIHIYARGFLVDDLNY